ncbi:MAG: leucine-rich repeat domain-containing protein [Promethearchaeota archaeon]
MEKRSDFVMVRGKKYYVKNGELDLSDIGISDITEVEGLGTLITLKRLDLSGNRIQEIKGLEHLTNLSSLNLSNNQLRETKGLEKLPNLTDLYLENNHITSIDRNIRGFIHIWGNPINKEEPDPNNDYAYSRACIICGHTGKLIRGEDPSYILRWESSVADYGTGRDWCKMCGAEYTYKGRTLVLDPESLERLKESETIQENHIPISEKLKAGVKGKFLNTPRITSSVELSLDDIDMVEQFDEFGIALGYRIYSRLGVTYTTAWRDLCPEWKKLDIDLENVASIGKRKPIEIFYTYKDLFNQRYIETNQTLSKEVLEHLAHERKKFGAHGFRIDYYEQWKDTRFVLKDDFDQRSQTIKNKDDSAFVMVRGKKYSVRNGKLDLNDIEIGDITEIEGLGTLINLKRLNLSGNKIHEIRGLEYLTNLQELNLGYNQIQEIKGLEALSNLLVLDLKSNQINGIKGLETLTNLQVLDLSENRIKMIKELDELTKLQELRLPSNEIEEIKNLENLTDLLELEFRFNPIRASEEHLLELKTQEIVRYCQAKKEGKIPFVTIRGKKYYFLYGKLDLYGVGISDITEIEGVEKLSNLQELSLNDNQINEIKGLEHLTNLKALNLCDNHISEIKGLDNLNKLDRLYLDNNQITEIKGLENLSNLKKLYLNHNQITEIKGLEYLINLKELALGNNPINDEERPFLYWKLDLVYYCQAKKEGTLEFVTVEGERYYVKNGALDLSEIEIGDITEIKGLEKLTNLRELILYDQKIREIKGLENLKNLKKLCLGWNKIEEIKGLETLTELNELWLAGNPINEIQGLKHLTSLEELFIYDNQINEIKGLEHNTKLKTLVLRNNQIDEIKGLERLTNLEELDLSNNQIDEIKGLENLTNLKYLFLWKNQINEIKGLENLKNLQWLYINDNNIEELKGLEHLVNLKELALWGNPINDDVDEGYMSHAEGAVKYCQEKAKKAAEKDKG